MPVTYFHDLIIVEVFDLKSVGWFCLILDWISMVHHWISMMT